jgi:DNA polymerase III alpha subunit
MVFTLWRDQISKFEDKLFLNTLVVVSGRIGYDEREKMKKIFIDRVETITSMREKLAMAMRLYIKTSQLADRSIFEKVKNMVQGQRGNVRLELAIDNGSSIMSVPTQYYVTPEDSLIDTLEYYVNNKVEMIYSAE